MNKFKQFISKYDTYIVYIFLLICTIGPIMNVGLTVGDEIWNFQNVAKLCNGFEIYKDANIIITPLFFYIGVFICKLFGVTLFAFKIYNVILISILYLLVYEIFKILKLSKVKSLIYTLIIYIKTIILCTVGANYNILVILFFIIGLMISIKESTFRPKIYNVLQGIIIFMIFLTKQNVAVYYIMGLTLSELLPCNKNYKSFFKSLLIKMGISLLLILTYLIILYFTDGLNNFINYTILGIPEFSNNFSIGEDAIKVMISIFTVSVVAYFSVSKKNNTIDINSEIKSNIVKLLTFGICMEFMAYPIFNLYHSVLGAIISYILCLYLVDIIFVENFRIVKKCLLIFAILMTIGVFIFSLCEFKAYMENTSPNNCREIQVYKYTIVDSDLKQKILNLDEYIKYKEDLGTNVVILSKDAAVYMIPLKESNGDMDLPFLGNMGSNGETKMLEKLKNLKNTEILITEDEKDVFWQESKIIRKYITQRGTLKRKNRNIQYICFINLIV